MRAALLNRALHAVGLLARVRRRGVRALALSAVSVLAPLLAQPCRAQAEPAAPSQPALRFSGYGTLAWTHSDETHGREMVRDLVQPSGLGRSTLGIDSRLGLQGLWSPAPEWELIGQVQLRKRAAGDPPRESLEWAFANWKPHADWQLQFGRFSPDSFLHANVRNVGFAMPWVRPNGDYYGWIPFTSINGISVQRHWQTAEADWRLNLVGGASSDTAAGPSADLPQVGVKVRIPFGFSLTRETHGWTAKLSYLKVRSRLSLDALAPLHQALDEAAALPVPGLAEEVGELHRQMLPAGAGHYLALGLQYEQGPWMLHSELARVHMKQGTIGGRRGYVSVGWRHRNVTLYGVVSASRSERLLTVPQRWSTELPGLIGEEAAAGLVGLGQMAADVSNGTRNHQTTLSLGARWDVLPQVALKFQLDRARIAAQGSSGWLPSTPEPGRATVATTALDVVF